MRVFLAIVLFLFSGTSSVAQQALANKPPKALGPVKVITYEDYAVRFSRDKTRIDEGVSNGRTVVWRFTRRGNLLTSEIFERDGRPSGTKSLYKYDKRGRLASAAHYLLGSLSYTETFGYPTPRRAKITRVFEFDKRSVIEIDEYDEKGHVKKAVFQNADGTETESYSYDDKGNPLEFVGYDRTGKRWIKETYQYDFDSYGNWTTQREESSADARLGIPQHATIRRRITYY